MENSFNKLIKVQKESLFSKIWKNKILKSLVIISVIFILLFSSSYASYLVFGSNNTTTPISSENYVKNPLNNNNKSDSWTNESGDETANIDNQGNIYSRGNIIANYSSNQYSYFVTGYFSYLGSITSRITKGWFNSIDSNFINSSQINSTEIHIGTTNIKDWLYNQTSNLTNYVPYNGANQNVSLGDYSIQGGSRSKFGNGTIYTEIKIDTTLDNLIPGIGAYTTIKSVSDNPLSNFTTVENIFMIAGGRESVFTGISEPTLIFFDYASFGSSGIGYNSTNDNLHTNTLFSFENGLNATNGIYGYNESAFGVAGKSDTGVGMYGLSTSNAGVAGISTTGVGGSFSSGQDGGLSVNGKSYGLNVVNSNVTGTGYSIYSRQFNITGYNIYAEGGKNYFNGSLEVNSSIKGISINLSNEVYINNQPVSKWLYNQTYSGSTFNISYNGILNNESYLTTYNATYAIWAYNQTLTFQFFNATYDKYAYNQTLPFQNYVTYEGSVKNVNLTSNNITAGIGSKFGNSNQSISFGILDMESILPGVGYYPTIKGVSNSYFGNITGIENVLVIAGGKENSSVTSTTYPTLLFTNSNTLDSARIYYDLVNSRILFDKEVTFEAMSGGSGGVDNVCVDSTGYIYRSSTACTNKFIVDGTLNVTDNSFFEKNLTVYGSLAWFAGNVSADDYITRTTVWDSKMGSALDQIQDSSYYLNKDGSINHTAFGNSLVLTNKSIVVGTKEIINLVDNCTKSSLLQKSSCSKVEVKTYEPIIGTKIEEGVSTGKEISLLKQSIYELKVKDLSNKNNITELKSQITTLNDKISNLEKENLAIKQALCKIDPTLELCKTMGEKI